MSGLVSFPGDVIVGDQSGDSFVVYSTSIHNGPVAFNSTVSFAAGTSITGVTLSGITFNLASNTLTGTSAQFNVANSDDDFVFAVANKAASTDVITGTDNTKYITSAALRGGNLVSGTAIPTTSGTSQDFTGIPSWVKRITIMLSAVSTNGTDSPMIQIGTSGGIEATGYSASCVAADNTAQSATLITSGFPINSGVAATHVISGRATLSKIDGNTWIMSGTIAHSDAGRAAMFGGSKTLSGALDRIRLTTTGGTNTFDAGLINIIYQ